MFYEGKQAPGTVGRHKYTYKCRKFTKIQKRNYLSLLYVEVQEYNPRNITK